MIEEPTRRPALMTPKTNVRLLLLNLHLYGGVIICWYLLIYGITSLSFNHKWLFPEPPDIKTNWSRPFRVDDNPGNLKLAETVRDKAGLIGWPLPWAMSRDTEGELHFELSRPGKQYWIHVDRSEGLLKIQQKNTGLASVLKSLHGMGSGVPNSTWMKSWVIYTDITTYFMLFAIGSGIFLWARRERDRRLALAVLLGSLAFSFALMGYVYWIG